MVAIALVPLTAASVGDLRSRVRAAIVIGVPIALGYVAVLANFERDVGTWNASLETNASYNFELAFPLVTIWRQAQKLGSDALPGTIGVQTLLVAAMVVVALIIAYRCRAELSHASGVRRYLSSHCGCCR